MILLDFFKSFPWRDEPPKSSTFPTLQRNNKDKYYLDILHKQLILAGGNAKNLAPDMINDFFGDETYREVVRFQQTHLGPDKSPLDVDGIVGPDSWWALFNFDGDAQRSYLKPEVVTNISNDRLKVVKVALQQHANGTREIPKGSNWGDGVTKFLKFCGLGPNPWCLAFVQWVVFEALKNLPWKSKTAHVKTFWQICDKLGFAFKVKNYSPIPGDLFVLIHSDGTGHIGIISNVNSKTQATKLNVVEGNSGDRVALRERIPGQNDHVGYINFYGDQNKRPDFSTSMSTVATNDEISKTR